MQIMLVRLFIQCVCNTTSIKHLNSELIIFHGLIDNRTGNVDGETLRLGTLPTNYNVGTHTLTRRLYYYGN